MKTLILSDIHANAPALIAVLKAALPCDRIVFLGDLANFGPHPSACVDLLQKHNPICIIGNHDEQITSESPKNFWDRWSRQQLSKEQLEWMSNFKESTVLDNHILLVHGAYSVEYDILPNTPDEDIKHAFKDLLTDGIDQVWFGHYHYQMDRIIDGVEYHCIRPVGHHRDKDTRAGYSIYEDGILTHTRVPYKLSRTIQDFENMDIFADKERQKEFSDLLKNAYHENLLKKDIAQMKENKEKAR